tara:strand:- start:17425 stop:18060 length:636 start_codon:yes stop_codon:yes gene_type:complete
MEPFVNEQPHPVEIAFAEADPDPFRNLERITLTRLRYTVCYQTTGLSKHLENTARFALKLATHLNFSPREQETIWFAASVHDIGKIGISPIILQKEGSLTDQEFSEIQSHTINGHKILDGIEGSIYPTCADVALSHHERWDGGGYPNGIKGEEISLAARIVSIADVYDCITLGRPYRPSQSHEIAAAELRKCAGDQFDPDLIEPFLTAVQP